MGAICSLASLASVPARGATINVGNNYLVPNTAGQVIRFYVTGAEAVQGLNFNVQVGDGGLAAGGVTIGPAITSVDITGGTIFSGNNTGQVNALGLPQIAVSTITTSSGTVPASGLLAAVTFDTTGFFVGSWSLSLSNTLNGSTDFAGIPATIQNGTISTYIVVPEASSVVGGGMGLMLLLLHRRASTRRI